MALGPELAGSTAAAGPLLDVRNNHDSHASDQEVKDIYAYGAGLYSTNAIVGLSDFTNLQTLSLHGNQIERIEGLEVLHQLVTLNLSSNNISWMEGLSQLKNLRVLNLSNNRIREIAGLQGLVAIRTLTLSHNEICFLGGLSALQGLPYALQHLDLRDNLVEYLCELWILGGCSHLEEVVFECGGYTNPVCKESGYRSTILSAVPRLHSLDGGSCMGHAPLFNTNISSKVPSLWAMHHSYPGHQNTVNLAPKLSRPPFGKRNHPSMFHNDATDGGQPERSIFRGKHDTVFIPESSSCETNLQDRLQKSDSRYLLSRKPRSESSPYQGHCLQGAHDSHDQRMQSMAAQRMQSMAAQRMQSMAAQEHESDAHYARSSHHTMEPKYVQQAARRSVPASAESLIVDAFVEDCGVLPRKDKSEGDVVFRRAGISALDFEAQRPEALAGTDASRIVRFVDQDSKAALDKETYTTRELPTQTESVSRPTSDQVCQEGNYLQSRLSTITVMIDGNASYTETGKQHFLAGMELYKKEDELSSLVKEKKTLENDFAAFKTVVGRERDDWHADHEHKSVILTSLQMNLKGCKVELQNLRRIVVQTERKLIVAVKRVESSIVLEEAKKLSLNSDILALKEALNSALNTCQTVGTALNDANHEKEKAKTTLETLTAALDEQRSKVKLVAEMLVTCTHQERSSRRECNRLKSELDMVCKLLKKTKDSEAGDQTGEQTAPWQAHGRQEAENLSQQMLDELHRRLVITNTMVAQALQENAKAASSMKKLRDTMLEKMLQLGTAFEAVTAKERGAKELIAELSCIVSAQKMRSEWMQHELSRLPARKEEVEHLQAEIIRLQERSNAAELQAVEAEALKCELATVTSTAQRERKSAEEAACAQFSSLMQENNKLAARASSLVHKFKESELVLRAKTEACNGQEATIQQLQNELVEAKNDVHMLEAHFKLVEDDLVQRLEDEMEHKCELRTELTLQGNIISEMKDELRLIKSAKYAAEQACKSLQQKVNDVDLLLRHMDDEISSVKSLYEDREKTIFLERNDALAKVIVIQKKLEDVEGTATASMQAHFESTKMMEAKEKKSITTLIQKDIIIEDLKRKVLEAEAELHSRDLALENQKAISAAKVEQLGKVLEELREVT